MTDSAGTPQPATDYSLSEVDAATFRTLANIAAGLSEAELRTCLYLASIEDPTSHTARASSREIADCTRLARANVQRAIDSLNRKHHLTTRQGSGQTASIHQLNWVSTVRIPAPLSGLTTRPLNFTNPPGVASQRGHSTPVVASQRGHYGPLDIDIDLDSIIDRTLTARPQHFQRSELNQIRSYAYKWLLLQRGKANAPPPDDTQCAQILTAAGSVTIAVEWIRAHLQDRQADHCGYLVSALLQQLHGIAPPTVKRRRAELRAVTRTQTPAAAAEPAQLEIETDYTAAIAATAAAKKIR